jgi:hypothetical protein
MELQADFVNDRIEPASEVPIVYHEYLKGEMGTK